MFWLKMPFWSPQIQLEMSRGVVENIGFVAFTLTNVKAQTRTVVTGVAALLPASQVVNM